MFKASQSNSSLEITAQGTFQILVNVIASGQAAGIVTGNPRELATGRWALVHGLSMLLLDGMLPHKEAIALTRQIVQNSLTGLLVSFDKTSS